MQDGASSGEYALELWDAATGSRAAEAASAGGCATTPVYDACADGPAAVEVRLRCINGGGSGGEPCQVRVAAYMSACPGGPQPQAVALDGGSNSGGDSSSTGSGAADAETTPSPPPSNSPAPGSSSDTGSDSSGDSSGDDSFAGLKTTTWIAIGVGAAALLLVGGCACRMRLPLSPTHDLHAPAAAEGTRPATRPLHLPRTPQA